LRSLPEGKNSYFLNLCYTNDDLKEADIYEYYKQIPISKIFRNSRAIYSTFDIELPSKEEAIKAIDGAPKVISRFWPQNSCSVLPNVSCFGFL
jgi:hypothetical protein